MRINWINQKSELLTKRKYNKGIALSMNSFHFPENSVSIEIENRGLSTKRKGPLFSTLLKIFENSVFPSW